MHDEPRVCPACGHALSLVRARCYRCTARPRTGSERPCRTCGSPVYAAAWQERSGQAVYCSRPCRNLGVRRLLKEPGSSYVANSGYRTVYLGHGRRALEHRLVMAGVLGRPLTRRDEVHHLNGDKLDNRPENLVVVSPEDHQRIYHPDHPERSASRRRLDPVRRPCERCGVEFERPGKRRDARFCSRSCRSLATAGRHSKPPEP